MSIIRHGWGQMRTAHTAIALVVCLSLAGGLAACSSGAGPTGGSANPSIDTPGGEPTVENFTDLPDDFPAEIPLINRDIDYGFVSRDGSTTSFGVWITADASGAAELISSQMTEAGFAMSPAAGSTGSTIYESDKWLISVTIDGPGTDPGTVVYTVSNA